MEKVEIKIEAAKEITDIGLALEAVVLSAKQAAKDGFQAGQDIPAVALASWQPLIEAIKNADQIGEEAKDPAAVAGAIGGMVTKITQSILTK